MKVDRVALVLLLTFSFLLAGSLLASTGVAETIEAIVKYEPKFLDLAEPYPTRTFEALIKFEAPDELYATNIDPATVLLEGVLPPIRTGVDEHPPQFEAVFDGYSVVNFVIWPKLIHMGIMPDPKKPTWVYLTITGQLYDETPWQGTDKVAVRVTANPLPPPPPPPP